MAGRLERKEREWLDGTEVRTVGRCMADAVAFSHNFMRRQSERNKLWMYIRMYICGLDTCAVLGPISTLLRVKRGTGTYSLHAMYVLPVSTYAHARRDAWGARELRMDWGQVTAGMVMPDPFISRSSYEHPADGHLHPPRCFSSAVRSKAFPLL